MISCTRRLHFCSGHRVVGHENKCANVHGHNYVVFIEAEAELDGIGRVIDFSVLKEKIGGWLDEFWDHTFIAYDAEDPELLRAIQKINNKLVYRLPANPTAENMAQYLLTVVCPLVLEGTGVTVTTIEIWETENCKATASIK